MNNGPEPILVLFFLGIIALFCVAGVLIRKDSVRHRQVVEDAKTLLQSTTAAERSEAIALVGTSVQMTCRQTEIVEALFALQE